MATKYEKLQTLNFFMCLLFFSHVGIKPQYSRSCSCVLIFVLGKEKFKQQKLPSSLIVLETLQIVISCNSRDCKAVGDFSD